MLDFIKDNRKPVITLGLVTVIAYVFYFLDEIKTTSVLVFGWGYAVPLVLAAMVGIIGERTGVVNIGIEGQMLMSAFASFFGSVITGNIYLGMLIGIAAGLIMGGFLAVAAVKWEMDQIIAGVVINIVAAGLTSFFYAPGKTLPQLVPVVSIPILSDIPLIGPVFFRNGIFALATLFIVLAVNFAIFKTRWGLRSRSVGEYPSAANQSSNDECDSCWSFSRLCRSIFSTRSCRNFCSRINCGTRIFSFSNHDLWSMESNGRSCCSTFLWIVHCPCQSITSR
jgi:simple sugar transport system permease protein